MGAIAANQTFCGGGEKFLLYGHTWRQRISSSTLLEAVRKLWCHHKFQIVWPETKRQISSKILVDYNTWVRYTSPKVFIPEHWDEGRSRRRVKPSAVS